MRDPDLTSDGWCLDDGEAYHLAAPTTFWIPDRQQREGLEPGDYAKLIFQIALDGEDGRKSAFERMWVIVRERTADGYVGVLDNDPDAIEKNDLLWSGTALPFQPRHIINILKGDEASRALAMQPVRIPWPPS